MLKATPFRRCFVGVVWRVFLLRRCRRTLRGCKHAFFYEYHWENWCVFFFKVGVLTWWPVCKELYTSGVFEPKWPIAEPQKKPRDFAGGNGPTKRFSIKKPGNGLLISKTRPKSLMGSRCSFCAPDLWWRGLHPLAKGLTFLNKTSKPGCKSSSLLPLLVC